MIIFGALFWTTTGSGAPPPTPTTPSSGASGADSQWTPPGWLLDILDNEERLAEEAKKLKHDIKRVAKRKAEVQEQISRPSQKIDYGRLVALVMELQQQLQAMLDTYRAVLAAIDEVEEDKEGAELMELLALYQGTIQ